jgi:uncharacterized repeat protein (TIGR01451 family)
MNFRESKNAVSEIISTILLLAIASSFFGVIYLNVLTPPTYSPPPITNIAGKIEENNILLEHRGGEQLDIYSDILIMMSGKTMIMRIEDYLDSESKEDGLWGPSEKIIYPLSYDFDLLKYPQADIIVVDKNSDSVLMTGVFDLNPICDVGVEITVNNQFPSTGESIVFTITVTNHGNINVSSILINFKLPEELIHYSNTTLHGNYTNSTGIWSFNDLIKGESYVLDITSTVEERGSYEPTQLVMLLDGSGSIAATDWTLQVEGLAAAISNENTFPHDGSVELTVIQFGGGNWDPPSPGLAKVEIGPVKVNESNNYSLAESIRNLIQLNAMTPTACGIYKGADTVFNSLNFSADIRQIIMMVTDGNPTQGCDCDGDYQADDFSSGNYKGSAEIAKDYLINALQMTDDQDEFNSIAVGQSASHATWLKESIVWPDPGYFAPPFRIETPKRGWVRNVTTWQEFADSINESFGIIFNSIPIKTEIGFSNLIDPKEANNIKTLILLPNSS